MTGTTTKPKRTPLPSPEAVESYGAVHVQLREQIDQLQSATWDALQAPNAKAAAEATARARAALKRAHQALDRFATVLDRRKRGRRAA